MVSGTEHIMFESSVNPEGIQTYIECAHPPPVFESSVNPEGIQTDCYVFAYDVAFESSVNPEGIQTCRDFSGCLPRLRAV